MKIPRLQGAFSDTGPNFISNPEPCLGEEIQISIRVCRDDFDAIRIHYGNDVEIICRKSREQGIFDYFGASIPVTAKMRYYFTLHAHGEVLYYNARGIDYTLDENFNFTIVPGFKTPAWARGAIMYQIYIDRFANGDASNDVVSHEYLYLGKLAKKMSWNAPVENLDICNFHGGDLAGVMQKMAYLKGLGVQAIYFNPLFVSPSNHKYDIQDYDYIDPHYGVIINDGGSPLDFDTLHNRHASMYIQRTTDKANLEASNELMIRLIELAHANDIKVILDGVFNHCGAFNKWLDSEGLYGGAEKKRDYFVWNEQGNYEGWWGHDNHPKLNFKGSQELYDYMMNVAAKWVSPPFNADGWRLDVAADLGASKQFNHKFWADFRNAVKTANPNAIILAEHYGCPADWLDGKQWDTIMNYDAFMEPVGWFFTGMQKHSEKHEPSMLNNAGAFEAAMRYHTAKLPWGAVATAMNQLSNHDHSRFLTRTNMKAGRLHTAGAFEADMGIKKAVMMAAVTLQFTWQGCPTIYYGDEAGLAGWTDPDNRRPYPWGREDRALIALHKAAASLRQSHTALQTGSLDYLLCDYGVLAYARWDESASLICAFNNNPHECGVAIPAWRANIPENTTITRALRTANEQHTTEAAAIKIEGGLLKAILPPFSATVFVYRP